jgi:hypothetical protein
MAEGAGERVEGGKGEREEEEEEGVCRRNLCRLGMWPRLAHPQRCLTEPRGLVSGLTEPLLTKPLCGPD